MRVLGVVLLVAAIALGAYIGCGPQVSVAQNKIVDKINKLLGELDVKREKIDQNYQQLKKDLAEIREKRIRTQVNLENAQKKEKGAQENLVAIKKNMEKLVELTKGLSESGTVVAKNGKTYTKEDLEKNSTILVTQYKSEQGRIDTEFKTSIGAYERSFTFLQAQESKLDQLMKSLEVKLREIDSRKVAMEAVKVASDVGSDSSVLDRYKNLESDIEGLFADVETEMRKQEENLKGLESQTISIEEMLGSDNKLESSISEIESILNGEKK